MIKVMFPGVIREDSGLLPGPKVFHLNGPGRLEEASG